MYNHKKIITKHKSRLHYGCTIHMTGYILWNKNQKNIKILVLVFKRFTITEKKNNEIEKFHHHWIQEWETFKIVMLEKKMRSTESTFRLLSPCSMWCNYQWNSLFQCYNAIFATIWVWFDMYHHILASLFNVNVLKIYKRGVYILFLMTYLYL